MERNEQKRLIEAMLGSPHGDLSYYKVGLPLARQDPYLFGHFVAYDAQRGKVRDAHDALPIIALRGGDPILPDELTDNALGHLARLDPRHLLRAITFHQQLNADGLPINARRGPKWLVEQYLRRLESREGVWDMVAVRSRNQLKKLYIIYHIEPSLHAQAILFDKNYPPESVFEAIKNLNNMEPERAAAMILKHNIPLPSAIGPLGGIDRGILIALADQATYNELVTNLSFFERHGDDVVMQAVEQGLQRKRHDRRADLHKAEKAAASVQSERVKQQVVQSAEDRIDLQATLAGDWVILGDKSGSMSRSIELAKQVTAGLARYAERVHLIFFDSAPHYIGDMSGKSMAEIKKVTRSIRAGGTTSIGCGMKYAISKGFAFDAVVIVSDGGQNAYPSIHEVREATGNMAEIYHLHVPGDQDHLTQDYIVKTEVPLNIDFYSLPNLVATLAADRYQILDDVRNTSLITVEQGLR